MWTSACAANCISCNIQGADLCDTCENNYLLDGTHHNCSRQYGLDCKTTLSLLLVLQSCPSIRLSHHALRIYHISVRHCSFFHSDHLVEIPPGLPSLQGKGCNFWRIARLWQVSLLPQVTLKSLLEAGERKNGESLIWNIHSQYMHL